MKQVECGSMSAIYTTLANMPDKTESYAIVNGIFVERIGTVGWSIGNRLHSQTTATMKIALDGKYHVDLDMVKLP